MAGKSDYAHINSRWKRPFLNYISKKSGKNLVVWKISSNFAPAN
jgi:hypothetical protein